MDKVSLSIWTLVNLLNDRLLCHWKCSNSPHKPHRPETKLLRSFDLITDGKFFMFFVGYLTTL
jgi:hypothetical protein